MLMPPFLPSSILAHFLQTPARLGLGRQQPHVRDCILGQPCWRWKAQPFRIKWKDTGGENCTQGKFPRTCVSKREVNKVWSYASEVSLGNPSRDNELTGVVKEKYLQPLRRGWSSAASSALIPMDERFYKVHKRYCRWFTAGELKCLQETSFAKSHQAASKPPATRQRNCLQSAPCHAHPRCTSRQGRQVQLQVP